MFAIVALVCRRVLRSPAAPRTRASLAAPGTPTARPRERCGQPSGKKNRSKAALRLLTFFWVRVRLAPRPLNLTRAAAITRNVRAARVSDISCARSPSVVTLGRAPGASLPQLWSPAARLLKLALRAPAPNEGSAHLPGLGNSLTPRRLPF
jgi:hypothetical protein